MPTKSIYITRGMILCVGYCAPLFFRSSQKRKLPRPFNSTQNGLFAGLEDTCQRRIDYWKIEAHAKRIGLYRNYNQPVGAWYFSTAFYTKIPSRTLSTFDDKLIGNDKSMWHQNLLINTTVFLQIG